MTENEMIYNILNKELELSVGCTEPGALALAGAYAGAELSGLGENVQRIEVNLSANMIKNAMAASVPGTDYKGIPHAVAVGAICAEPEYKLEVISRAGQEVYERADALVRSGKVKIKRAEVSRKLYIEVACWSENHKACAVIADLHTNLILLKLDDKTIFSGTTDVLKETGSKTPFENSKVDFLTLQKIYNFIDGQLNPLSDSIEIVRQAVSINSYICEKGLEKNYGLAIGRGLEHDCRKGYMTRDMVTDAMIITSAGIDARMAGAPFTVVTNTGSGNQGIMATMPIVSLAKWKKISDDKMLRAVTLSHLVVIRIKSGFGRLSALCGASVAAVGAACGITYLLGGDYDTVCRTVHNIIGNITGMLCDGAKSDCALKISTCVNAAFQAAFMALRGIRIEKTDGIIDENVECTMDNLAILSNKASVCMDNEILHILLNK